MGKEDLSLRSKHSLPSRDAKSQKPCKMLTQQPTIRIRFLVAGTTVAEPAGTALDNLSLGDGNDVDGDGVELEA